MSKTEHRYELAQNAPQVGDLPIPPALRNLSFFCNECESEWDASEIAILSAPDAHPDYVCFHNRQLICPECGNTQLEIGLVGMP